MTFAVTVTFASFLIEDMFILFNNELNLPDLLFREAYLIIGWGWVSSEELGISRRVLSASADNTLQDVHNSSDKTKAEFNNCSVIHSKYF